MSFEIFALETYSANQQSSAIDTRGSLGIKLDLTVAENNGSGVILHLWACDDQGAITSGSDPITTYSSYENGRSIVGVQLGVTAESAEPSEGYFVVAVDAALTPFVKVTMAKEDAVDQTYGLTGTLF